VKSENRHTTTPQLGKERIMKNIPSILLGRYKTPLLATGALLLVVAIVAFVIYCFDQQPVDNASAQANATIIPQPTYKLDYISPTTIRVVGMSVGSDSGYHDFSKALARGLDQLSAEYDIISETPVISSSGDGRNVTTALIVRVKPKSSGHVPEQDAAK